MKTVYIKYLLALVLFGSNGIVASRIHLSSYEIVLFRTLIGSLFLVCVFLLGRQRASFWRRGKSFLYLIISGVAMGISWVFLFEAYRQIGVSLSTLAYYCGPVLVMVLSPLVFQERLGPSSVAGFLCVVLGMVLVNGAEARQGGLSSGLILAILSAVMYAAMVICNKKAKGIEGLENAMCQLAVSCVVVALFTGIAHRGAFAIPRESVVPLLFLGVVNTGVGCYFYFSSIPRLSAQSVSICGYFEPLSALLFSALFLAEKLTAVQVCGAVLILGGAALGELIRSRRGEAAA